MNLGLYEFVELRSGGVSDQALLGVTHLEDGALYAKDGEDVVFLL